MTLKPHFAFTCQRNPRVECLRHRFLIDVPSLPAHFSNVHRNGWEKIDFFGRELCYRVAVRSTGPMKATET